MCPQQREQNKTASILSALIGNRNCVSLFSVCVCVCMCEPTSPVSHNSQMDAQSFLVLCGTLWGVKGLTVTQNTNTHVNTQRHVQLTQEKLAYTQTHGSAHIQYIAIALFTKFNNLHTHTHIDGHTHARPSCWQTVLLASGVCLLSVRVILYPPPQSSITHQA